MAQIELVKDLDVYPKGKPLPAGSVYEAVVIQGQMVMMDKNNVMIVLEEGEYREIPEQLPLL